MNAVGHYWIVNNYDLQADLSIYLYMIEKLQTLRDLCKIPFPQRPKPKQ